MIGSVHSGCLLEKKLGEGGMGTVYLATRREDGRHVAVKFMPPEQASHPAWRKRFIRTAEMVQEIRHPNVARVISIMDGDPPHLVMELVKGEPLDERLKRKGVFRLSDALKHARDIARGLAEAHRSGLVHRDVKPANMLLTPAGKVKVIDFGLGKITFGDEGLTFAGQVLGTPNYMAPEQWGEHEVDHRCDIFSLGSTLYHMATGKLPFKARRPAEVGVLITAGDFLPPRRVNRDLPEEVELVIYRMMEVDRNLRYQSMDQLADDLQRMVDGRYPNLPRLELITKGEKDRRRFPLMPGRSFKIGRSSATCDIVFTDRSISREHAEIKRELRGFVLKDLGSSGGSYVRDSRVKTVALKDNDMLRLGKLSFLFRDGMPDLASSTTDDLHYDREEVQCVSEPILRALVTAADRRVVLTLIEQLDPATHAGRLRAIKHHLTMLLGAGVAAKAAQRCEQVFESTRKRLATRLFMITHEKLGQEPRAWLAWWDQRWGIYPTQVGPNPPPLLPRPSFRVVKGDLQGDGPRQFELSGGLDFLIGRVKRCAIHLAHGSVSRQHATCLRLHERMAIRDESSRLGTIVNGDRVQVTFLHHGDTVRLGKVKLTFEARLPNPDKPPTLAGVFPIDPQAFEALVELDHPATTRALIAFLQGAKRLQWIDAEARLLHAKDADVRKFIIEEARKQFAQQLRRAEERLPRLLKVRAEDLAGWKEAFASQRKRLGPQVLPMGWMLPI